MLRKRTPYALAAALLVALAVRAAEPEKYLPDDSTLVVHVNVKQALESPLGKAHLVPVIQKQLKQNASFAQGFAALGLDPLKDFDSLTLASSGVSSSNPDKEASKLTAVVRGAFDPDKVHAAADALIKEKPKELSVTLEGGVRVYQSTTDEHTAYFALLDKTTLIAAGSKANVVAAVKGDARAPKFGKEMAALVAKADGKQTVWFVGQTPDELKKLLAKQPQTMEIADKVYSFSGGVTVAKGVAFGLDIHTADAKTAEDVSQYIDAAKSLVLFATQSDKNLSKEVGPELLKALSEVVDAVQVGATKETATVRLKVSEDAVNRLVKAGQAKKP